jgi:histidinol phosphatase-like PHP family hydrolase
MPARHDAPAVPTDIDVNVVAGNLLRDLAFAQSSKPKQFGYKRAAAAVFSLERPLSELVTPDGSIEKVPGLGPASTRVCLEVLRTGGSPTVEAAVAASGKGADIERRRGLRDHVMSRAAVIRALNDATLCGPSLRDYRGDLQMHSEWSDGACSIETLAEGCLARGYEFCAITDHSYGLPVARGMSMAEAHQQHAEIDRVNARYGERFHIFKGVEANIRSDGPLDIADDEAAAFEVVLAAPHSKLGTFDDQTGRLLEAMATPGVHVLAHPRGRMAGSRPGLAADWPRVFETAARLGVAIELDGDPARQDLDYALARLAVDAGCLFSLDSDAHTVAQLRYAETAIAHARLAGIPTGRIINCWRLDKLTDWLAGHRSRRRAH